MTRNQLLYKICPTDTTFDCRTGNKSCNCYDCERVMSKWLDKHDKQIRADAIDDFARELHKGCSEMIKQTWGSNTAPISWAEAYADFKVDIDEIAKQLKEQKK